MLIADACQGVCYHEFITGNIKYEFYHLRGSLYKIMFIFPVVSDHLSWETTKFSGHLIQVSLYL